MWFSQAMNDALNTQIGMEFRASQQYVAIAAYFDTEALPLLSARYYKQAEEERAHAMRLIKYVLDAGGKLQLPQIPAMEAEFASAEDAVAKAYEGERDVTNAINTLLDGCMADKDHLTSNFLQWFIAEQREELASAETMLKLIQRSGGGSGLIQVESYLGRRGLPSEDESSEDAS